MLDLDLRSAEGYGDVVCATRTTGEEARVSGIGLNLVTASAEQLERERAPWIGRQLQPRHCGGIEATVAAGFPWSAAHRPVGDAAQTSPVQLVVPGT